MRKYLILMLALVSIFALAGCGSEDSTGVFKFTDAEIADGKNLPEKYENGGFTLQYPENWSKPDASMGQAFVIMKDDSSDDFKANMNVIKGPTSKEFGKMSIEDFKKEYSERLKAQQINNMEVIKAEKGKWQGADAIYVEYKATFMDYNVHYAQYLADNGKDLFIITFVSSDEEWTDVEKDMKKIASSVTIAKDKK